MDYWSTGGGSLHCVGGWAIALSGIPIREPDGVTHPNWVHLRDIPESGRAAILAAADPDSVDSREGEVNLECHGVAAILLGIDYTTAIRLFYYDAADALRVLNELIDPPKEETCPTPS